MLTIHHVRTGAIRWLAIALSTALCFSICLSSPSLAADPGAGRAQSSALPMEPSSNPFDTLPAGDWSYDAVRELAAEGLITGYQPKANQLETRSEMAVLVNQAVVASLAKLGQSGPGAVKQSDLVVLKRLIDAFAPELREIRDALADIRQRTTALEEAQKPINDQIAALNQRVNSQDAQVAQVTTLSPKVKTDESNVNAQLSVLNDRAKAFQGGFVFWNRPGSFAQRITQSQPGGESLPTAAGAAAATFGTMGSPTPFSTSSIGRPIDFQAIRFKFSGSVSPQLYYAGMLDGTQRFSNAQGGTLATTPSYCTTAVSSLNCGLADSTSGILPAESLYSALPTRITFGFIGYNSPGGVFAKLGRLVLDEGLMNSGISFAGPAENGVTAGFRNASSYGYIGMLTQGTLASSLSVVNANSVANATGNSLVGSQLCPQGAPNLTPAAASQPGGSCISKGSVGLVGMYQYTFPSKRMAVGVTYDNENGVVYNGFNNYAGLCVTPTATNPVTKLSNGGSGVTGAGAGGSVWNTTTTVGVNSYCPTGTFPLVTPSSVTGPVVQETGAYQTVQAKITTASAFVVQYAGPASKPTWRFSGELLGRLGNDPFSTAAPGGRATSWKDNESGYLEAAYASKGNLDGGGPLLPGIGIKNSNVVVLSYMNQGLNSINFDQGLAATLPYQSNQIYGYSYFGMSVLGLNVDHWYTKEFRVGLTFQLFTNRNVGIPSGSTTCPGCIVSGLNARAISLDTYLVTY